MKKQLYLLKNSFTIIETIVSLILVSIIVSSFSKLILSNSHLKTYENLNTAQNEFIQFKTIISKFDDIDFITY